MNPTHGQDNHGPDTRTIPDGSAGALAALLTDATRFNTWIARSVALSAPAPAKADTDGYVVTDTGLTALAQADADAEAVPGGAPGTVALVLRLAAMYLQRHGWIQGAYYDMAATVFTPAADLVGAIGMVCYGGPCEAPAQHFDDPGFLDFEEAVLHLDRWLLVHDGSEAYEFNDAKGRTPADVLRVLRLAADTPTEELVDALRAINAQNADTAVRVKALTPSGIWGDPNTGPTPDRAPEHVDYPHQPGTLYDCPACEATCYCTDGFQCMHCALAAERDGDGGGGE